MLGMDLRPREIELLADAFRRRGRDAGPPIDVEALALIAGIGTIAHDELRGASAVLVEAGDVMGVVLNRNESMSRRRFSLAHEIAHRVLHPDRRGHVYGDRIASRRRNTARDPIERACDYFAACLLMPRKWVQEHAAWASSARQLARRFEVSEAAMKARLRECGENRLAYP